MLFGKQLPASGSGGDLDLPKKTSVHHHSEQTAPVKALHIMIGAQREGPPERALIPDYGAGQIFTKFELTVFEHLRYELGTA